MTDVTHRKPFESPLPEADGYCERVASLFATRMPATIMSALFVLVAGLVTMRLHDTLSLVLLAVGAAASGWRLRLLFKGHAHCASLLLTRNAANALERRFGAAYIAFAAVFGCFSARTLTLPDPPLQLSVVILIVGYAAGAIATTALRPAIAAGSVLLAVVPPALALAMHADPELAIAAICLLALLAGSLRSLAQRHRAQARQSATSSAFASLARRDPLTGLLNRFALAEAIEALERAGPVAGNYALHYLDLDGFKQVNDHLGHAAGDAILRAVGERLSEIAAPGDVVARLGGDEFVIMQARALSLSAIADRAQAIQHQLSVPHEINGQTVFVGASVGSSSPSEHFGEMDALLEEADVLLRNQKRSRSHRRE